MAFEPIHNSKIDFLNWGALSFAGSLAPDGYFEGVPNSDRTNESKDAGGYNVSISKMADDSGTITLQLQTQSTMNAALAEVVRQDRLSGGITIHNFDTGNSGSLYMYDYRGCYIKTRGSDSKSADVSGNTTTWVFYCSEMVEKDPDTYSFSEDAKANISGSVSATVETSFQF